MQKHKAPALVSQPTIVTGSSPCSVTIACASYMSIHRFGFSYNLSTRVSAQTTHSHRRLSTLGSTSTFHEHQVRLSGTYVHEHVVAVAALDPVKLTGNRKSGNKRDSSVGESVRFGRGACSELSYIELILSIIAMIINALRWYGSTSCVCHPRRPYEHVEPHPAGRSFRTSGQLYYPLRYHPCPRECLWLLWTLGNDPELREHVSDDFLQHHS